MREKILLFFAKCFILKDENLRFRAKIFAAILAIKESNSEDDLAELAKKASEIYGDSIKAILLKSETKRILNSVRSGKICFDMLLKHIAFKLTNKPNLLDVINLNQLRDFLKLTNGDELLVQERVYEFFFYEITHRAG